MTLKISSYYFTSRVLLDLPLKLPLSSKNKLKQVFFRSGVCLCLPFAGMNAKLKVIFDKVVQAIVSLSVITSVNGTPYLVLWVLWAWRPGGGIRKSSDFSLLVAKFAKNRNKNCFCRCPYFQPSRIHVSRFTFAKQKCCILLSPWYCIAFNLKLIFCFSGPKSRQCRSYRASYGWRSL